MGQFLPARNWRTVCGESSVETQTNSMFLPWSRGSLASLAIDGISRTHGPHQVAQKLRKTVLPLNLEKRDGLVVQVEQRPVVVGRLAHARVLEQPRGAADRRKSGRAIQKTTKTPRPMYSQILDARSGVDAGFDRSSMPFSRRPRVSATGASRFSTGA